MNMNDSQICEAVKNLREDSGLTQLDVRKKLGLVKSAYSNLENGIRNLKATELLILLDLYGINLEEFQLYAFKEAE